MLGGAFHSLERLGDDAYRVTALLAGVLEAVEATDAADAYGLAVLRFLRLSR
ncbi:hypothetical protein [Cryobacterium breve]